MNIDRLICNLSNVIEFSVKCEILNTHSLHYSLRTNIMLNYRFFYYHHYTPAESSALENYTGACCNSCNNNNKLLSVCVCVFIDLLLLTSSSLCLSILRYVKTVRGKNNVLINFLLITVQRTLLRCIQ